MKDLLSHEFFAEGVKVEVMTQVEGESEGESTVVMRVEVPRKVESKQNGQETVEFTYNLVTDKPEDVVGEMVSVTHCVVADLMQ